MGILNKKGVHLIVELHGCSPNFLANCSLIRKTMLEAAKLVSGNILSDDFVIVGPGISGTVVITESHLSIHTWPEDGYASVDIYTCSKEGDPIKALELIVNTLKPTKIYSLKIMRGLPSGFLLQKLAEKSQDGILTFEVAQV